MSKSYNPARKRLCATLIATITAPAIVSCSAASPAGSTLIPQASRVDANGVRHDGWVFNYTTLDAPLDPTTQLWGINNQGKIVGSYGDGSKSNPYIGLVIYPPYGAKNFKKADYPGAANTVITSLSNNKIIAGWYEDANGLTWGCTEWEGIWQNYQDPKTLHNKHQDTQILGIEDDGIGVGFYQDSTGSDHAFELDLQTDQFHTIDPPNAKSAAATAINGKGDVAGWEIPNGSSNKIGWLLKGGQFTTFADPNGNSTIPYGVNWQDDIVGAYTDSSGTHGFILSNPLTSQTWQKVDEPNTSESKPNTVVTSVNNHHAMVGFYTDTKGNVDGFLALLKGSGS